MADETKGPSDASNDALTNTPGLNPRAATLQPSSAATTVPASEPEARILEETIIPRTSAQSASVTKQATPPIPPAQNLPPRPQSTNVFIPSSAPATAPTQTAPKPAAPPPVTAPSPNVFIPSTQISDATPTQNAPKPVPQAPSKPAPAAVPAPILQEPALTDDIAKILNAVKLPERNEQKGSGDIKVPPPPPHVFAPEHVPSDPVPTMVTPRDAEQKTKIVVPVHTLKDDLQGVVRDKKMSVVRAVSLEEDKRARQKGQAETPGSTQRSKRVFGIVFSILLLLVLGGGALLGVFTIMQQRTGAPPIITSDSILFSEQSVLFSLSDHSPSDLKRTLAAARNSSNGTLGSITRIIPVITVANPDGGTQNRPATFAEFMKAIGSHAPDDLIRAAGNDFFLGLHTVDENAPLLVVPVVSYDHAFAGMLTWEVSLNADLAPAFTGIPTLKSDQNGIPSQRTFQDLVMRNYDVRALKDDANEIQLYYSFPTQNILVIAESPYTFTEILSRLQAGSNL